ncbi:hypothetical protein ABZP36_002499 [Zizania latifolia]
MSSSHPHDGSSVTSTPRAGGGGGGNHHAPPLPPAPHGNGQGHGGHGGHGGGGGGGAHVRLMCSFGGRILPRPGDHQLRYVGGETRIVSVPRSASFDVLLAALAKVFPSLFPPGGPSPAIRYQLPQDDLDALISITSDDDVDNLIEEIDRFQGLAAATIKPPRLRLFLFASSQDHSSAGPFGSVLSGAGDASSDQWFVDALNAPAPAPIGRGRSEASSIISEVPDYLFGLDNTSDEPSPGPGARPNVDTEMEHGEEDAPAPARGTPQAPYVTESAPWPAPPPPYMTQQVYYVPMPAMRPVHYLDPSAQGGYMPGPVYHIVGGGGGIEARGDLYSAGGDGGVYGVPHPMQPFPPMMYGHAPPGSIVYSSEGKPPEGGAHYS